MAPNQRQARKVEVKPPTAKPVKSAPASNSNIWILAVAFALLILYVLYNSISIYSKDRMYNDFEWNPFVMTRSLGISAYLLGMLSSCFWW